MSRQKKRERNICIIKHCRSYREAGMWPEPLTFHEFPADLARRKQWLQILGREDWIPGDKAKLCGAHFPPESYRISETVAAQKRLILTAVPSLNLVLEPLVPEVVRGSENNSITCVPASRVAAGDASRTLVCSVPNCWQHKESNKWPEPVTFFEIPADPLKAKRWITALEEAGWSPASAGKKVSAPMVVCSSHFAANDFQKSSNKEVLKNNAVPSINMKLKNLFTEVDAASAAALEDIQLARTHSYAQRDLPIPPVETRKRFSNIIIVDLIKDNKKLKLPERPPQPTSTLEHEGCPACLEMKKDLREVEFQLALVRKELEEQKKLVEKLKKQIKED